jgi:cytochrome c oxidase subunit 2
VRALRRRAGPLGVLLAGLLLAACSDKAPSTLDPKGPAAESISRVWWLMFGLATAVYIVVGGLIIVGALRGRGTEGRGRPSKITDRAFIIIGGLVVPSLILGVLAVVTVASTDALTKPEKNPLKIEVRGYRWWWEVRYPEQRFTTANEVRIPVGRPVEIGLRTNDVLHSFWVPELAGKVDLIPGQRNIIRIEAKEPGDYRGLCAEFCGVQHAKMMFLVRAERPADFERWLARQQRPPSPPSSEEEALGQVVFTRSTCGACHTVRGTDARGKAGPDLSDFGSRKTIGAAAVANTRSLLGAWIVNSQSIKPGNLMPPIDLDSDELLALMDYLESLR